MDLEVMLQGAGFDVTTIMSCDEAIDWLGLIRPDLVIIDVVLQDGRSDEVARRLVADNIPFIVHSGDHASLHVGTPFEHGKWISKPAAQYEVLNAANRLLAKP
jgi:DNA-binding response OmpR family regulator